MRPKAEEHSMSDYERRPPAFPASLLMQRPPKSIIGASRIAETLQSAALRAENSGLRDFVETLLAELCVTESNVALGAIEAIAERLQSMKRLLPLNDGRAARRELDALIDDVGAWLRLHRGDQ